MSNTAAIAVPKENENTIQEIPLDRIRPSEDNPRSSIDATSVAELAASIQLHGVLQPILVRPAPTFGYEIICGERRW